MHYSKIYVVCSPCAPIVFMSGLERCVRPRDSTVGKLTAVDKSDASSQTCESCLQVRVAVLNCNPLGQVSK